MTLKLTKNNVWSFYKWSFFLIMLESLKAWFFWDIPITLIVPILFVSISIIVFLLKPEFFSFKRKSVLIIIFLYLLTRIAATRGNINSYLAMFITSTCFFFFVALKDDFKKDFLVFFTRVFSVMVCISLLGWILYLFKVNLPYFSDSFGFSERRNDAQYIFQNYYVFLLNISQFTDLILPRFSSVFLEPGYFSLVLVILLYLNNFNFKKRYNKIFVIALFFTFSLAGWLIAILVYIAYWLKNSNKKFITFLFITFVLWASFSFFSSYNNGNNSVNELILSRLQYDESKGKIKGYNRTNGQFNSWFNNSFLTSNDVLLGLDMKKVFGETSNVGWKVYMVNYGIVGLLLYLLFLFYVFYKYKNYENLVLFFIYILIFIRGDYVIYLSVFPILYLSGCTLLKNSTKQLK